MGNNEPKYPKIVESTEAFERSKQDFMQGLDNTNKLLDKLLNRLLSEHKDAIERLYEL